MGNDKGQVAKGCHTLILPDKTGKQNLICQYLLCFIFSIFNQLFLTSEIAVNFFVSRPCLYQLLSATFQVI